MSLMPSRWRMLALLLLVLAGPALYLPAAAQTIPTAADQPNTGCVAAPPAAETGKFTFLCHADPNLALPRDTTRIALFIGNAAYVGTDTANTRMQSLGSLGPPCDDVKMLAKRLSDVGWQKKELYVLCDQTGREMNDALTALFKVVPDSEDSPKFVMFYYAGHGLKIARKNYLAGINARVDWEAATNSFIRSAASRQGFALFEDYEAVDLYDRLSRFSPTVVFPLLVVIDSCRDNPMVGDAKKAFDIALQKKDHETALRIRGQASIELSGPTTGLAKGIEIWFATLAGRSIDDDYAGSGHSHLSSVLSDKMRLRGNILRVRQEVSAQLESDETWATGSDQALDKDGDLFEPLPGPPCFGQCRSMAATAPLLLEPYLVPTVAIAGARTSLLRQIQFKSSTLSSPSAPQSSPLPNSPSKTYTLQPGTRSVNLDIFWCSGDENTSVRYDNALAFFNNVDALLKGKDQGEVTGIGSLRIRELTAAQNAKPGYQRSADELYRPADSISATTAALALDLGRKFQPGLKPIISRSLSGTYVSVFFCKAAFKGVKAPRVYLQVATSNYLTAASGVISYLDREVGGFDVIRTTQIMAENSKYPLEKYPPQTVVKYTKDDQADNAKFLACRLSALTGIPIKIAPIVRYKIPHQLEVWVGNQEALSVWRNLGDKASGQPDLSTRCPLPSSASSAGLAVSRGLGRASTRTSGAATLLASVSTGLELAEP